MKQPTYLLAFSGGLDTSTIIPWLKENKNADVIAVCADLGQVDDVGALESWAKTLGAKKFIFLDLKEVFVKDFFFPMLLANATYQDDYLLGTALARPLIAKALADVAIAHQVDGIIHGATGKGNDQIRFEKTWARFCPDIPIMAPWKIWDFKGRQECIQYLQSKGFDYTKEKGKYSVDTNILHNSTEGAELENPLLSYSPAEVFQWVQAPEKISVHTPSADVHVQFEKGIPTALNGKAISPADLMETLNELGKTYGLGVVDLVEERVNGIKSRGIYETPGGTILYQAIKCLKQICWDKTHHALAARNALSMGELIYCGDWYTPAMEALKSFFQTSAQSLSGEISLRLWPGFIQVLKRESAFSLYDQNLVSFESDEYGINEAAKGYVKTLCLKQKQYAKLDKNSKGQGHATQQANH